MATLTVDVTRVRPLPGSVVTPKVMAEASKLGRICFVAPDGNLREAAGDTLPLATGQLVVLVAGSNRNPDGTVAAGEAVDALEFGRYTPGFAVDPTKQYYLANITSTVKGLYGDAVGSNTRRMGKPEGTEVFFFNPQEVATTYS